jgi:hypothetical protein
MTDTSDDIEKLRLLVVQSLEENLKKKSADLSIKNNEECYQTKELPKQPDNEKEEGELSEGEISISHKRSSRSSTLSNEESQQSNFFCF